MDHTIVRAFVISVILIFCNKHSTYTDVTSQKYMLYNKNGLIKLLSVVYSVGLLYVYVRFLYMLMYLCIV